MEKGCLFRAKCSIGEMFVSTSGGRDKTSLSLSLLRALPALRRLIKRIEIL
jgi:hypothetical protein